MSDFKKTEEELKKELPADLYQVARGGGTEAPFTGKFLNNKENGFYMCKVCGAKLFSSDAKFDSGTGWPSFDEPENLENIELKKDESHGMTRTEVVCKSCGSHLGHVFDDLPAGRQVVRQDGKIAKKRYCINSVCLGFQPEENK